MKRVTIIATLCSIAVTFVIVGCSTTTTSQQGPSSDSKGRWSAKAPMPIQISENAVAADRMEPWAFACGIVEEVVGNGRDRHFAGRVHTG
jgi:hypothetical protein